MTTQHDDRTTENQALEGASRATRFRRARYLTPIAVAVGVIAACSTPGSSSKSSGVVRGSSVAPSSMTSIVSGFRSQVSSSHDVGRMAGDTPLTGLSFRFRLSAAQKSDRDVLMAAQQDPLSPSFRRWLTPDQYASRFGVAPAGLAQVTSWLQKQGFTVTRTSRAGTRLFFSGTVAQVEAAFEAEMHRYDVGGKLHFALSTPAQVPNAIGDLVLALHGADDFRMHPPKLKMTPVPSFTLYDAGPPATAIYALSPEDYAKIYDVPNLFSTAATPLNGEGITISIVGESEFNQEDITGFRNFFGLPPGNITEYLVPGSGDPVYDPDSLPEASLDLEWSGGLAPGANISYVYTGDNQDSGGAFDAMTYVLDELPTPVLSMSFSACEPELQEGMGAQTAPQEADEFLEIGNQANLEGVTFVAAAGDTGPAGCEPNDAEAAATMGLAVGLPASIPGITGVGGTAVANTSANWSNTTDANGGSVILPMPVDTAWNDTFFDPSMPGILAGGGGQSSLFLRPVWQTGTGVPTGNHRYVPDVALSAGGGNVPFLIAYSYTAADGADASSVLPPGYLNAVVGTSGSTPSFAGILAILNQALLSAHVISTPGLGNVNPELYALVGDTSLAAKITRDVVGGNNCVPCTAGTPDCPTTAGVCPAHQYGFAAGVGYDEVTGLGTIDALNMVNAWKALAPTTTTLVVAPTSAGTKTTVTLTATVTSTATTPALTGTVSFYDQYGDRVGEAAAVTTVSPATAITTTTTLPPGVDEVFAWYSGDDHYVGSFVQATTIAVLDNEDAGYYFLNPVLGGGVPVLIFDAGVDASSLDASPPPVQGLDGGSGVGVPVGGEAGLTSEDGGEDGSAGEDGSTSGDDDDSGTVGEDSGSEDSGGIVVTPPGSDDAGTPSDASTDGPSSGSGSSSGCSCVVAGSGQSDNESRGGAIGGVMLGLVALVRRRRARK